MHQTPEKNPRESPRWGEYCQYESLFKTSRKGQSVSVQGIVNYYPSCPSRILIEDLKVLNSFAEGSDKMDIVNATQSTCSKAEACLDKGDDTFETLLESQNGVKDKKKGKNKNVKLLWICQYVLIL